ncbi:Eukaryotic translation initiation factor 5A [Phlyctochytrium bullatum]|nr:Eukaryotic translation initiation factor 5A [Phlyctochytrium bullatum]
MDEGLLSLMTSEDDVKLPDGELGERTQSEFSEGKEVVVTVVTAMGEEMALSCSSTAMGEEMALSYKTSSA